MWTLASMEPVDAGFLSVLPPLVALVLAFITKEVITSILSGVFVGTIIYTVMKRLPIYNAISIVISLLVEKMSEEMEMVIFITLLGGLIIIMKNSGGARAYGIWAIQRVKTRIGTEFSAMFMSFIFFVDDYFNCLTTSTVLKPLARSNAVSMEKLAFIIHAIANNICLLVPFSSWAAAIASNIKDAGISGGLSVFIRCIPYNFYPVLIIFFVFLLIVFNVDYGSMRHYEELCKLRNGNRIHRIDSIITPRSEDEKEGSVWDLIVPILLLIGFTFLFMLCTGGYFTNPKLSILEAFMEGDAVLSLSMATLSTLLCCVLLLVPRKQMTFNGFVESVKEGAQYMAPTIIILAVAWTMSGVTNELLGTGEYLGMLITKFKIPVALLPTVFFLLVAVTAFALGNAWCCFGIFIPIASKICMITAPNSLIPTLAAVMGGAVFGDQASLLSETTILLVSTMECTTQSHFKTQLPYLLTVFVVSLVSYVVCGFTQNNLLASWVVGLAMMLIGMVAMYFVYPHLKTSQKDMYYDNEDETKKGLRDDQAIDDDFLKSLMYNDSLI
ncbi:sodium/proton antiporter [Blastocystis sp. ATCC 50177/Nand II]|uniref:Sodium/proton antiporter n=1 Tax=Blastocystis sp. subtype 1 (strain ATCC 50177 / NandII) TaxID=478820 RepID=A0A196SBU5_BLAHN|nr:sodium/proton antiporter [Blastocystis sp. ATCC 50177/Nand II]